MLHHLRRSIGTGHSQRLWPVLLILLSAVVLPTGGVLWFMNEAIENEQLAVRQRLTDVYASQMAIASAQLQAFWQKKLGLLSQSLQANRGAAAFGDLVNRDVADSIIIYDPKGRLTYPDLEAIPLPLPRPESPAWKEARRLEYEQNSPANAAGLYLQIAQRTGSIDEAAGALVAHARCLHKAGRSAAAVEVLTGALRNARYRSVSDERGRHILPNALLLALNLVKEPAHPQFQKTAASLVEMLNDYGGRTMPSGQRRFLMKQLQTLWPACPVFPTQQAEELAVAYLEAHPQEINAGRLLPTVLPRVWAQRTDDNAALALFRQDRLLAQLASALRSASSIPGARLFVTPPGATEPH